MRERPATVPAEAIWSEGDDEWELASRDSDGKKHGLVTYWRPDGTLVNHCHYEHGVPHGWYKRYHESGEVSRSGTFVDGKMHGVDACFRSTAPTTERAFPANRMPDSVWRYEVEMIHGKAASARWYDRDSNQVTETGEPFPPRPTHVPGTAVYLSKPATWVDGVTDDDGKRHGLWRAWSRDGAPVAETDVDHGTDVATRRFECAEDAEATVALREGRRADAAAAAGRWWERAQHGKDQDRILAGELYGRTLDDTPSADAERRRVYAAVADVRGVGWVFTDEGRRSYQAQAAALDWLARDALAAGKPDDALALCDRAIATEHHYGPCAARSTKITALRRLGRDDDAFTVARDLLVADPDRAGLDDLRADPRFSSWLASIRTDDMTVDGAWDVLGRRGERLDAVTAPMLFAPAAGDAAATAGDADDDAGGDEDEDVAAAGLDRPWPVRDVLRDRISPELARWLDVAPRLRATYRGEFHPAVASTIAAAIDAQDGTWIARLQGLFLPVSAILIEDEEIWHATWVAGPDGASLVYYIHQDEPGWSLPQPSIAAFVVGRLLRDSAFEELPLPAVTRERYKRAIQLLHPVAPTGDVAVEPLVPRIGWIVEHLLGIATDHGLAEAPGVEVWHAEKARAGAWPHLQAYWLLHHLVFDNVEELPYLLERADRRHPAVGELAELAAAACAGRPVTAAWWNDTAVRGLRTRALDRGHARVMTEPARARLRGALADRDAAKAAADAARADLAASGDPSVAQVLELWQLLESAAGKLVGVEEALLDQAFEDSDERMSFFMRQKNGHTSILLRVFAAMSHHVGPACRALFDAEVRRGAAFDEDHASVVPGAVVGLGAAMDDFAATRAFVEQLIGDRIGRRRRMELAIVATTRFTQPGARAFVVGEAERYARQLAAASWQVDTVAFPLFKLLELEPVTGGRILAGALADAKFSGANWQPAILLIQEAGRLRVPDAGPGILAAIDRGLGRHDDGDRAVVVRAYTACAGAAAAATLEPRYRDVDDVRADCERCALLAGLIDVAPTNPAWQAEARTVLDRMLAGRLGSMENGAAISLLRSIAEAKLAGFAELAGRMLVRARDDKYTKARHTAWLAETQPKLT